MLGVGRVWLRFSVRVGFSDTEVDLLLFVLGLVRWFGLVWFISLGWVGLGGIGERRVETGSDDRDVTAACDCVGEEEEEEEEG